ncbi:MAG: sialate O-acetylesterase [bacterium]|nr:sialate O-acetylesterase [bacterium]
MEKNTMRKASVLLILFLCMACYLQCTNEIEGTVYKLYYLGGQSNMDGYGYVNELPAELNSTVEGVMIYHGNSAPDGGEVDGRGIWTDLQPGHGVGFKSDGIENTYSERHGVELTFAKRLLELDPDSKIAILKYSRGGTSIDAEAAGSAGCWEPDFTEANGINQYDHFLSAVEKALSVVDIDGDGKADKLIPSGLIWMQGESDAYFTEEIALRYEANLTKLMGLIRTAFKTENVPVVIGRISDSGDDADGEMMEYCEIVRKAQMDFVNKDINASLVTETDEYGYSDSWHYDTMGFIEFGKRFAEAVFNLQKNR